MYVTGVPGAPPGWGIPAGPAHVALGPPGMPAGAAYAHVHPAQMHPLPGPMPAATLAPPGVPSMWPGPGFLGGLFAGAGRGGRRRE